MKFVLLTMGRSGTAAETAKESSLSARLFRGILTGWRRVATVAAAVLAIGLGYHVVFGQNGLTAYQQKGHDAKMLDGELKSLARENELLKGHVERLKNDPNAIEHQAREELHYTRAGEVIYTLPSTPTPAPAKSAQPGH
jgi:cell division protein FtsB